METITHKPGIANYVIRYGLLIAAFQIVSMLVFYLLDMNPFKPGSSVTTLVLTVAINVVLVRMAMIKYRQVDFEGRISFGQLFLLGALILFLAGIVSGLFSHYFYQFFDADFLMRKAQEYIDSLIGKVPDNLLELTEEKLMKGLESGKKLWSLLLNASISAVVLSLIISLFIKKDTTLIPE